MPNKFKAMTLLTICASSMALFSSTADATANQWGPGVQCTPVSTHEWCAVAVHGFVQLEHYGDQAVSSNWKVKTRVICNGSWRESAWSQDNDDIAYVACSGTNPGTNQQVMISRQ
jgi:hypothetical protein